MSDNKGNKTLGHFIISTPRHKDYQDYFPFEELAFLDSGKLVHFFDLLATKQWPKFLTSFLR